MKKLQLITRLVLGVIYGGVVIMTILNLMPHKELEPGAQTFVMGLLASKYLIPFVKAVEGLCAIAFLTGSFLPLATVIIFPITLNIFLYHVILDPAGTPVGLVLLVANLLLAYTLRDEYAPFFRRKLPVYNQPATKQ
jgi:putative oxidoreductase